MIKTALKLLAVLVVGILLYNLFLGTSEEKEGAKKIVGEMKDVGVAVKDLLKSEKEKFDKGKYDKAIDKVGTMLTNLRNNAKEFDEKYLQRIEELEKKRQLLKEELNAVEGSDTGTAESEKTKAIKEDSKQLLREIEELMNDLESGK